MIEKIYIYIESITGWSNQLSNHCLWAHYFLIFLTLLSCPEILLLTFLFFLYFWYCLNSFLNIITMLWDSLRWLLFKIVPCTLHMPPYIIFMANLKVSGINLTVSLSLSLSNVTFSGLVLSSWHLILYFTPYPMSFNICSTFPAISEMISFGVPFGR